MNINGLIQALEKAKNTLGGETEIGMEIEINGNCGFAEIEHISHSAILGLHIRIKNFPYWILKNNGV